MDERAQRDADEASDQQDMASLVFTRVEHWITIGIGAILVVATLLLLTGTVSDVWDTARHWPATDTTFLVVDKLLFTLMLVEILHTVRQSISRYQIAVEPFLIVGLIACVRRILIVTVETANQTKGPDQMNFEHAMVELGVLGGLTLVLIVSIYLSSRSRMPEG